MLAGHILLGRPWQYDHEVSHNGRTNHYSFSLNNRKYTLALLEQSEVCAMQTKEKASTTTKVSLFAEKRHLHSEFKDMMPLYMSNDPFSGYGAIVLHTATTKKCVGDILQIVTRKKTPTKTI